MFGTRLEATAGSPVAVLDLAAVVYEQERRAGCHKLQVAATWADLHTLPRGAGSEDVYGGLDRERLIEAGPRGCPKIAETAPAELGLVLHTSPGAAKQLIRDALNLRHRLPRIWARVEAGEVQAWKARKVASRSAHLNPDPATELDRLLAGHLETLAWHRFEQLLDATLLQVDEKTYRERADEQAKQRDVWATQSEAGMRTLIARCAAGDVTVFLACINLIADALADEGDEDPVSERRSKAIGILAYPDRALDLLLRHAHTHPHDPDEPGAGCHNTAHGSYHQPDPDDPDYRASFHEPADDDDSAEAGEEAGEEVAEDLTDAPPPRGTAAPEPPRYANTGGLNLKHALAAFGNLTDAALAAARPKMVIHLHLTDETVRTSTGSGADSRGVIRTEHGPITTDQLRRYLGDTPSSIHIHPVLDPARLAPIDAYEIPLKLRLAAFVRNPASIFPFSPALNHHTKLDLDHLTPYRRGGPPGQTSLHGLAPLARPEHRPKTHSDWQIRQPDPGTYLWRSPHGIITLVTNQGTLLLGRGSYATELWQAAEPLIVAAA